MVSAIWKMPEDLLVEQGPGWPGAHGAPLQRQDGRVDPRPSSPSFELDHKRRLELHERLAPFARRLPKLGRPRRQREREWAGRERRQPTKMPPGTPKRQLLKYRLLNSIHFSSSCLTQRNGSLDRKRQESLPPRSHLHHQLRNRAPEKPGAPEPGPGGLSSAQHPVSLLLSLLRHWPHSLSPPHASPCLPHREPLLSKLCDNREVESWAQEEGGRKFQRSKSLLLS